jgi:hypothetical protein
VRAGAAPPVRRVVALGARARSLLPSSARARRCCRRRRVRVAAPLRCRVASNHETDVEPSAPPGSMSVSRFRTERTLRARTHTAARRARRAAPRRAAQAKSPGTARWRSSG